MSEKALEKKSDPVVYSIWFKRNNKDRWANMVATSKEEAAKKFWEGAIKGFKEDEGEKLKDHSEAELFEALKKRYQMISVEINTSYEVPKA